MINKRQSLFVSVFVSLLTIGFILLFLMLYLPSQASSETTYTVNTIFDTDDGTCNGVHCSLREAINAANSAAGADSINFNLPPNATIILTGTQLPTITNTLTIDGSMAVGLTISGTNFSRVFHIDSSAVVTLTALIISDGDPGYPNSGGALYNAGGTLIIIDSIFDDNIAYVDGGAVYNEGGDITINGSTFSANRIYEGKGGAIYNDGGNITVNDSVFIDNSALTTNGGGIYNSGSLTINGSALNNNRAGMGGSIYNANTLLINNSVVGDNQSSKHGGGIYNNGGMLTVTNSTFDGNRASDGFGGGIYNSGGALNVSNSTFSGNSSQDSFIGGHGGGIANFDSGTLNLSSSTFSENSSDWLAGGIYNDVGSILNFENTIIANSIREDCLNSGTIGANVSNLVEDGGCNPALSGDPLLGPLQDNGGPTWTHALTSLSLAIDAGDEAACAAPPVNNLDQRGVVRPIDGDGDGILRCDIGAYEYPLLDKLSYLPLFLRN